MERSSLKKNLIYIIDIDIFKKEREKEVKTMPKNTIIFILIVAIIILGGILVFSTTQNNAGLQPRILVSEEWDFGKVTQGEKPTHIFIVKNGGEGDLIIEGVKGSCPCIETSISTNRIKPGESAELKVSYDTTDYVGKDEKHLHIYSNDPQVPDKWISLYVETEKPKGPYLEE